MFAKSIVVNKLLTFTLVVFLTIIGLDKILQLNLITDWQILIGPVVHFLLPIGTSSIVIVEGCIEIILAVLLVSRWKKIGLLLLVVTIVLITIDVIVLRYFNLAIREIIIIIVCLAVYLLDEINPETT